MKRILDTFDFDNTEFDVIMNETFDFDNDTSDDSILEQTIKRHKFFKRIEECGKYLADIADTYGSNPPHINLDYNIGMLDLMSAAEILFPEDEGYKIYKNFAELNDNRNSMYVIVSMEYDEQEYDIAFSAGAKLSQMFGFFCKFFEIPWEAIIEIIENEYKIILKQNHLNFLNNKKNKNRDIY